MDILANYFKAHLTDIDSIDVEDYIIRKLKKLNRTGRSELSRQLFEFAQHNSEDFTKQQLLNWFYHSFLIIDKHCFRFHNVYFSPGHDIKKSISQILSEAESSVDLCVFTITDQDLSRHIRNCNERGLKVRIITDDEKTSARGSEIWEMAQQGVLVKTDRSRYHMHNKFGIIDNRIALTGSFNWTYTATKHNQENLLATSNVDIVNQYLAEFNRLWDKMFDL